MLVQLLLGSAITLISLTGAALLWWVLNEALLLMEPWLRRPPTPAKSLIVIFMAVLATMAMMTLGVWLWAIVFAQMLIFSSLEEAVYYSLVAYTTLGLGDVVVPQEQRLLGGDDRRERLSDVWSYDSDVDRHSAPRTQGATQFARLTGEPTSAPMLMSI
ncbi:MAG: two pore domain potassium channel family protein [Tateyamaria sp.]|uniref:hypothetical protein n=1 Tax=Alphaproteobacteria TaxID=28211 RepID=UPI00326395B8